MEESLLKYIIGPLVGGVIALIFGVIIYWVKEGFGSGKEKTSDNKTTVEKTREEQINLERRILESLFSLDKDISQKLNDLNTKIEILSTSTRDYQISVTKLEGRFEDLAKLREDVYRGSEVSKRMFERIFEVIDKIPHEDKHKNISRDFNKGS